MSARAVLAASLRAAARAGRGRSSRLSAVAALAVVLAFGSLSATLRFWVIGLDRTIGTSDTAAYAEIGRSLARGRGFDVQYISSFYIPYPRSIDRPDDHWPPLMGMLIAPVFATAGVSAFHAKIPAVLAGAVGLPLAAAWLGIAVSRRAWVGLAAGLLMVLNRQVFRESLTTLADVTLAVVLTCFCAAMIGARTRPKLYVVGGLFAALAYYAKLSELMLVGLFPVTALLIVGPRVVRQRWMYAGWAALVLGILPWQVSNVVHYGSPVHSIHNYASGFIGLDLWEYTHYRPYWGVDQPKTSDRWTKYADRYWPFVGREREEFVRLVLLGSGTGQADWYRLGPLGAAAFGALRGDDALPALEHQRPDDSLHKFWIEGSHDRDAALRAAGEWRSYWRGTLLALASAPAEGWRRVLTVVNEAHRATMIPNLLGAAYALVVLIGVPLRALVRRQSGIEPWPRTWGVVAALVLLGVVHGTLLTCFFSVSGRFTFPALPTMAVLGLTGVAAVASRIVRPVDRLVCARSARWRGLRPYAGTLATGIACTALLAFAAVDGAALMRWQQEDVGVLRVPRTSPLDGLAQWAARNLPRGAVIMSRYPWELRFYSPETTKTVATPVGAPQVILGIAYYYGVTHILADPLRPGLQTFLDSGVPGITRVAGAPLPLYVLDWSRIPEGEVLLPHQQVDARTMLPPREADARSAQPPAT